MDREKLKTTEQNRGSFGHRTMAATAGGLLGAASALAISAFKDSGASKTAILCVMCALVCGCCLLYLGSERDGRKTGCCLIPALLFAGFCLVGYSFAMDSTPEKLYGSGDRLMKTAAAFAGYTVIFFLLLSAIFRWLKEREKYPLQRTENAVCRYGSMLIRRPFLTAFLTMLVGYLPYMIASYPALFMGDCQTILPQGFGAAPLTTHHPVLYTLLLTSIIKAGLAVFHSWNAGVFLVSCLQLFSFLAVMAYGIRVLIRNTGVSWKWALGLELYFVISPRISNCMFVITKDVFYAEFLLLFGIALFQILYQGTTGKTVLLLAAATAGILIFRKDGTYVLLLSFLLFILFSRRLRKSALFLLVFTVLMHSLFNQVIYPSAGIEKGSIKEMLSIPLQQTARCTKYLADSLTEEEKGEILDLFYFDSIEEMGETYDPSLVDYIKFKFPEQVDRETLGRYLRLWASMGRKYPATYVNAFLNNYFEYVYPGCIFMQCSYDWSETCFARVNEKIGSDFSYPSGLNGFRHGLEQTREKVFETWPFRILNMPGMTTWFLIGWTFWLIYTKNRNALMLTIPLFIVMLICVASPCNGYYCRYQYPLLAYIPWGMLAGKWLKHD